jgi:hypothetical protein
MTGRHPTQIAPPRMQPLARLPLFFSLDGRRALIAGGTQAAAQLLAGGCACAVATRTSKCAPAHQLRTRFAPGSHPGNARKCPYFRRYRRAGQMGAHQVRTRIFRPPLAICRAFAARIRRPPERTYGPGAGALADCDAKLAPLGPPAPTFRAASVRSAEPTGTRDKGQILKEICPFLSQWVLGDKFGICPVLPVLSCERLS